eukprot:454691_1
MRMKMKMNMEMKMRMKMKMKMKMRIKMKMKMKVPFFDMFNPALFDCRFQYALTKKEDEEQYTDSDTDSNTDSDMYTEYTAKWFCILYENKKRNVHRFSKDIGPIYKNDIKNNKNNIVQSISQTESMQP